MIPLAVTVTPEEEAIKENMVKYEELDDKTIELNSQIAALDVEIDTLQSTLKENNNKIKDTENKIAANNILLDQTKKEIEESQKKLDIRVRSIYKSGLNSSFLIFILEAKDFSDFYNRIDTMKRIILLDKKVIDEVNDNKASLDNTIEELNKFSKNLEELKESTELSLSTLEEKQNEQKTKLTELNTKKESVFATIEENEKKLISYQLSVVNSSSSDTTEIEEAIDTLNAFIPQLNSSSVIALAQAGINTGNETIANRTIVVSRGTTNGSTINDTVQASFTMSSTAYTGGGTTATGLKPVRDPNGLSTIAVDSSVIPLGSKVYVSGYGVAIASDTGGAIQGNIVDVYFNSLQECISWGRRTVTVEILAYPGQW